MYVALNENKIVSEGFRSYGDVRLYFRGYAIWNDALYFDDEFDQIIVEHIKANNFEKCLPQYNGIYNLVFICKNEVTVATDRWGIDPLYYTEGNNALIISDKYEKLKSNASDYNKDNLLQLLSFGFVFGDNTIIDDIKEFSPHSIFNLRFQEDKIQKDQKSYWELKLSLPKKARRNLEKEFVEIWEKQISIYTDYIQSKEKMVYMPFSGGLDCRIIAHELDKKNIGLHAMTYGLEGNDEIVSAKNALSHLSNVKEHYILELNKSVTPDLFSFKNMKHRYSCAFPSELLHYYSKVNDDSGFIITGFSGDFMAGSHIKQKMYLWKNKQDIVSHILNFKSPPFVKQQISESAEFKEGITEQLAKEIPDAENLLSSFIRWDVEQRQRKYIARSAFQNEQNTNARALLPFFDYKLMDFFLNLPLSELINARLYTNCQVKYLYKSNPAVIRAERNGKTQKVIRNNFLYEYKPKLAKVIKQFLGVYKPKRENIYKNLDYNWLGEQLQVPKQISEHDYQTIRYQLNKLYLYSISEAVKTLERK
jgi:asparagine synthetase B (glutamine-hydrolysing)